MRVGAALGGQPVELSLRLDPFDDAIEAERAGERKGLCDNRFASVTGANARRERTVEFEYVEQAVVKRAHSGIRRAEVI